MIDRYHEAARNNGVRIVHSCGFDSIPSDLGTWALQQAVIERDGAPCSEIVLFLTDSRGGVSGGTVASIAETMKRARDRKVRKLLLDPYALNPASQRSGPDGGDRVGPYKDVVTGWWTGPFLMASINAQVVRRTNALSGFRYGRAFRYSERVRTGSGASGATLAGALSAGLFGLGLSMAFPPTRSLLRRLVFPAPGKGPSPASMQSGFFEIVLSGRRDDSEVARLTVRGKRDPGYGATACMLAESTLCLARCEVGSNGMGGVLTPAVAMGSDVIERLDAQDVCFELNL
jgi:short subunit dehydrogenase-like uncharacterized protein